MTKRRVILDGEPKMKIWREGDMMEAFKLTRIKEFKTPTMQEWLDVQLPPVLNAGEQYIFDKTFKKGLKSIEGWGEEDLKMKFISPVLELGHMWDDDRVIGFFDKIISAKVDDIPLTVKSDFMLAKGFFDVYKTPYFHFQEYKPNKNPSGDSMAQLLCAFLIAQEKNKNDNPLYGLEIIGKQWSFVTMEGRTYCISKSYDATDKEDMLAIIAILRKFRVILYEKLMDE